MVADEFNVGYEASVSAAVCEFRGRYPWLFQFQKTLSKKHRCGLRPEVAESLRSSVEQIRVCGTFGEMELLLASLGRFSPAASNAVSTTAKDSKAVPSP